MKQLYTSLALLLVVAGVGGWIYFNERGPVAQTGSTVLLRLEPQSIASFTVQTLAGERLEFSRQDGKQEDGDWLVRRAGVKMLGVPADAATQNLLTGLQLVQSGAIINDASVSEIASYGLDKPRSSVSVGEAKIEFGEKPSFDVSKVYARVSGGAAGKAQIALLPAELGNIAYKDLNEWRDKSVLNIDPKGVTRLSVQSPALRATFIRNEKNEIDDSAAWIISTPVQSLAEAAMIDLFLQQLPQTKTIKFLEDAPRSEARWGLDKPTAKLEVTSEKGRSTRRVGRQVAGGWAAQNSASPAVFVLPGQLFGLMARPLFDWRDKSVLKLNTGRLKSMKVSARGKQMSFNQTDGKWLREDGEQAEKFSVAAMEIGFVLQKLSVGQFIDKPQNEKEYGLDRPICTLQLASQEWSGERTVQFGVAKGKTYVRVLNQPDFSPMILVLSDDLPDSFNVSLNVLFPSSKKPTAKTAAPKR